MKSLYWLLLITIILSDAKAQLKSAEEWIIRFRDTTSFRETLILYYGLGSESLDKKSIAPDHYLRLAAESYQINLQATPLFQRHKKNDAASSLETIYKISFHDSQSGDRIAGFIRVLGNDPNLEWMEPNRWVRVESFQSSDEDTAYWHRYLQTAAAWGLTRGTDSVVIGMIDTGIKEAHPALSGRIFIHPGETGLDGYGNDKRWNGLDDDGNGYIDDWRGWDFTDIPGLDDGDSQEPDNDPTDENGHGTAVAGILVAQRIPGGMQGIAPGCRVMVLRCGTASGWMQIDDIAQALIYAADNGVRIINMSFSTADYSELLHVAVDYAYRKNIVLIAAAGNDAAATIRYPAGYVQVIAVGATDRNDFLAPFSNFGSWLTLTAPGVQIRTTGLQSDYIHFSGTSASAPVVAGITALVLSYRPHLSNEHLRSVLIVSADDKGPGGWDPYYGAGRVHAYRALQLPYATVAKINHPCLNQGFSGDTIRVTGTVAGALLKQYALMLGTGNNPSSWETVRVVRQSAKVNDTLAVLDIRNRNEGAYVLRLMAENTDGSVVECRVRFEIDRTAPVVKHTRLQLMLEDGGQIYYLTMTTDKYASLSLRVRDAAGNDSFIVVPVTDFARTHSRVIRPPDLRKWSGSYRVQAYAELTSSAGLKTRVPPTGFWDLDLSASPVRRERWQPDTLFRLPRLHVLLNTPDLDSNGQMDLIANELSENHQYQTLKIFEYDPFVSGRFRQKKNYEWNGIPRDALAAWYDGRSKLLIGGAGRTFVLEAKDGQSVPETIIFSDSNDCWGSRFLIIPGDPNLYLLIKRGYNYQILRRYAGNTWAKTAEILNPSRGTNLIGIPGSAYGDFDADGNPEIVLGDYDGDIFIVEKQGDSWVPIWRDSLPLAEPNGFLASGDVDGDGKDEIVVGAHTPNPDPQSDPNESYWLFRAYRRTGNNQYAMFWEQYLYGYYSLREYASGLSVADVDGETGAEILVNVFPQGYIFKWNALAQQIEPLAFLSPVRGNGILVFDPDRNGQKDLLLNDGRQMRVLTQSGTMPQIDPPDYFIAAPLDTHRIRLSWRWPLQATAIQLWMGSRPDSLILLSVVAPTHTDTVIDGLTMNQRYYFTAVALSDSFISRPCPIVSAVPNPPPRLISGEQIFPNQIRLRFSEPMFTHELVNTTAYFLEEHGHPAAAVPAGNGYAVLLNFPILRQGQYFLTVRALSDTQRTSLDTQSAQIQLSFITSTGTFYIVRGEYLQQNRIAIYFNEPVEVSSASNTANYRVDPGFQVLGAEVDSLDPCRVLLRVQGAYVIGATGIRYVITARHLRSLSGEYLNETSGNQVGLVFTSDHLRHVYVYPNPCRRDEHHGLTFANLPPRATIKIYTADGRFVREVEETDGDGGVRWDLKDRHGKKVSAGVYLFTVKSGKQTVRGKLTIVR